MKKTPKRTEAPKRKPRAKQKADHKVDTTLSILDEETRVTDEDRLRVQENWLPDSVATDRLSLCKAIRRLIDELAKGGGFYPNTSAETREKRERERLTRLRHDCDWLSIRVPEILQAGNLEPISFDVPELIDDDGTTQGYHSRAEEALRDSALDYLRGVENHLVSEIRHNDFPSGWKFDTEAGQILFTDRPVTTIPQLWAYLRDIYDSVINHDSVIESKESKYIVSVSRRALSNADTMLFDLPLNGSWDPFNTMPSTAEEAKNALRLAMTTIEERIAALPCVLPEQETPNNNKPEDVSDISSDDQSTIATTNGWHGANDVNPSEYPSGPLTGTKTELTRWIFAGSDSDSRRLDTAIKNGTFWGREDATRRYSIWFKNEKRHAQANSIRLSE